MKEIKPQEVWKAYFPFSDESGIVKYRPVIVIDVDEDSAMVLSIMITSHKPRFDEYDIELYDWADIPLDHVSTARVSRNALIPKEDFDKKIGKLTDDDWENIIDLNMRWVEYNS